MVSATKNELTKAELAALDKHLEVIENAKGGIKTSVLAIGGALFAAREILTPKEFVPWVETNCRFSKSTAYNYLGAFVAFGSFPKIGMIEDDTALYLLAKNEGAANKAKELATKGYRIDCDKARELIDANPPEPKKPPAKPARAAKNGSAGKPEPPKPGAASPAAPAEREPGDDTEAVKAEQAKRRANGKAIVSNQDRKKAMDAIDVVTRFSDKAKVHAQARPHITALIAIVKGTVE